MKKFFSLLGLLIFGTFCVTFMLGGFIGILGVALASIIAAFWGNTNSREFINQTWRRALIYIFTLISIGLAIYCVAAETTIYLVTTDITEMFGSPTEFSAKGGMIIALIIYAYSWAAVNHSHWKQPPKDNKDTDDNPVLVFSMGDSRVVNFPMIEVLKHLVRGNPKRAIYTQRSIYFDLPYEFRAKSSCLLSERRQVSTYQVVKEFKKIAIVKNWQNVTIVAAEQHIARCARDMEREGFKVVRLPEKTIYFKNDTLWWVRNKFFWNIREFILRALPFWLYKRITG